MNREEVIESVKENGEVHIVMEEHESVLAGSDEDYIGLRNGSGYHYGDDYISIFDGSTVHKIPYDRIVYLQETTEFP